MTPFHIRLLAWAGLGVALHVGMARFTYGVMLPALKRDLALDYLGGGALNAVHLLGYLAGTLAAPLMARRLDMALVSRGAHVLAAAGALLCALAPADGMAGPVLLGIGRVATGLGAGAAIVAILVIAFAAVPIASRSMASAVVWSGMGFALVLSGLAAGWLVDTGVGWRAAFLVSAALAALLAFVFPPRGAPKGAAEVAVAPGFRSPGFFLVGAYLMFGAAYIAYSTFAGTRLAASGAALAVVSGMWIAFGAAMVAGSALSFAVLRFEGRRKVALTGALLLGALGSWVSWSNAAGAALAGALLVGAGLSSTPTIVTAYVRERCSAEQYPHAFSFATAVMGLGQLAGPLAAGALADRFGVDAVIVFALSVYALGALLAALDRIAK